MAVSFAKDIKAMFRQIDIAHMRNFGVNLDDYSYMADPLNDHQNARDVEDRLRNQSMPPDGPFWTAEQLAVYAQWRADNYRP